jgi:hypothetical protein
MISIWVFASFRKTAYIRSPKSLAVKAFPSHPKMLFNCIDVEEASIDAANLFEGTLTGLMFDIFK